jgi:regulatory protein
VEVREHLLAREIDPGAVEATIAELTEQGYLDDARFARVFVQDKRALSGWGVERIRRGLLERGIDRDLVEQTLRDPEDGEEGEGEVGRAIEVLRRRFPGVPRDRRDRERALGVLLRKGYDYEVASAALRGITR